MSERPFENLYRELQAKLEQRLEAIEADYRKQAQALEEQLTRQQQNEMEEARQQHKHRLQRQQYQSERQRRRQAQQRFWACQRRCMDDLLEEARRQLAEETPAPDYLAKWRRKVSSRLPSDLGDPRLRLSPAWAEKLGEQDLAVTTAPLLGGAVLEVPEYHLEVDGSWDRRLQLLTPQLWQRWLDHVGADDSD